MPQMLALTLMGIGSLSYDRRGSGQIVATVMATKEEVFWEWVWIVAIVAASGIFVYSLYVEKARQWHVDAVMNGPIRANTKSRIYHVPTCPNYESIHADNLRLFQTIEEANSSGYRQAQNCGNDFRIREVNESGDFDDYRIQHDYDHPRQ